MEILKLFFDNLGGICLLTVIIGIFTVEIIETLKK